VPGPTTVVWIQLTESGTKRFMSGAVLIFQPRGPAGLEVGAARFFHSIWPRTGIPRSYLTKPFEAILKTGLGSSAGFVGGTDVDVGDNQLASAFFRWVSVASPAVVTIAGLVTTAVSLGWIQAA